MKNNTYNKGATLFQYAIIIALVALAIVPILLIFGGNINKILADYSGIFKTNDKMVKYNVSLSKSPTNTASASTSTPTSTTGITLPGIKPGELSGTPNNPVKQCIEGLCSIDYGNFVLNNVPDDFNSFVETSGTSAGTKTIITLLEQVAQQQTDPKTTDLIRKLANYGHQLAANEKNVEDVAQDVINNPREEDFFSMGMDLDGSNAYYNFEETLNLINNYYLDKTQDQNSKNVKKLVNLMANDIIRLLNNMSDRSSDISSSPQESVNLAQKILHPQTSLNTNLDSQIICTTGDGTDKGAECN